MKASELRGRAVVSLAEAQKVGEIDDVLLAPAYNQVVGFRLKKAGLFGPTHYIQAADVKSVGSDAITIADRDALRAQLTPPDAQPMPDLGTLHGTKVVSESGALVGELADAELDATGLAITAYYLGGSLWDHLTQGAKSFSAVGGIRFGGEIMIIPDSLAHTLLGTSPPPATPSSPAPDKPAADSGSSTS